MQPLLYAAQPKGEAAKAMLAELRQEQMYLKHGVVFRRHKDGTVECLGPFYKVFKELVGGVKIVE